MNGLLPNVVSSSLYKIDRFTGATTLVGETGQKPLLTGSATIDPRSGRMFWTVGPDGESSYLCEVDLTTGAATKIMDLDYNRQVSGLYVETPEAEDKAPAKVQDADASFNGGSLSGTISFTAPLHPLRRYGCLRLPRLQHHYQRRGNSLRHHDLRSGQPSECDSPGTRQVHFRDYGEQLCGFLSQGEY